MEGVQLKRLKIEKSGDIRIKMKKEMAELWEITQVRTGG